MINESHIVTYAWNKYEDHINQTSYVNLKQYLLSFNHNILNIKTYLAKNLKYKARTIFNVYKVDYLGLWVGLVGTAHKGECYCEVWRLHIKGLLCYDQG